MLAGVFTPLFATALLAFLGAMAWTDRPIEVERGVLIAFDFLVVVVVSRLLDNTSARDLRAPRVRSIYSNSPCAQVPLALGAIASRITDSASPPNRVAALGKNLPLLVHLAW